MDFFGTTEGQKQVERFIGALEEIARKIPEPPKDEVGDVKLGFLKATARVALDPNENQVPVSATAPTPTSTDEDLGDLRAVVEELVISYGDLDIPIEDWQKRLYAVCGMQPDHVTNDLYEILDHYQTPGHGEDYCRDFVSLFINIAAMITTAEETAIQDLGNGKAYEHGLCQIDLAVDTVVKLLGNGYLSLNPDEKEGLKDKIQEALSHAAHA